MGPKTLTGLRAVDLKAEINRNVDEAAVEAAAEAGSSQNEPIGPASGRLPADLQSSFSDHTVKKIYGPATLFLSIH